MNFVVITATLLFIMVHAGAVFFTLRNMKRMTVPKDRFAAVLDVAVWLVFLSLGVTFLILLF